MKFNISSHLKIAYKIKTQLELNRFLVGFLFYIMYVIGKNRALKVFNTLRALFLIPVMYVTNVSVDFD